MDVWFCLDTDQIRSSLMTTGLGFVQVEGLLTCILYNINNKSSLAADILTSWHSDILTHPIDISDKPFP